MRATRLAMLGVVLALLAALPATARPRTSS